MTGTTDQRPIGVIGATGQQGRAVVDRLVELGAPVRAVVRNTTSDRSEALRARGVQVVSGDLDEPDSLVDPLRGLSALFLMVMLGDATDPSREVVQGVAAADAAARAGVPRVVYSSVGGAERHSGVPHFETKRLVELHLTSVLPTQIVRPAYFMDNLSEQLDGDDDGGEFVLRLPMPGDVALQMVAVRDIGRVAAAALVDADAWGADALEIAGDELTGEAIAAVIGAHLGRPARFEQLPMDALGDDDDLMSMFRWFVDTPAYQADFARTRAVDPTVQDLAAWLAAR